VGRPVTGVAGELDLARHCGGPFPADLPAARRLPHRAEADVAALEALRVSVGALVGALPQVAELECNP
jgi:hypothetical protein